MEEKSEERRMSDKEFAEACLVANRAYWEKFLETHTPEEMVPPIIEFVSHAKDAGTYISINAGRTVITCYTEFALSLSFEEFKAVLAHELGHKVAADSALNTNKSRERVNRFLSFLYAGALLSVFLPGKLLQFFFFSLAILFAVLIPLSKAAFFWLDRRAEYRADCYVAKIADPGALARALVKHAKVVKIRHTRWWEEYFHTHPRLERRLRYLRRWRDEKRRSVVDKPPQGPSLRCVFLACDSFRCAYPSFQSRFFLAGSAR